MHRFYFTPGEGRFNFPPAFFQLPWMLRNRAHVIEIKEAHPKRSLGANAYYWAVVIKFYQHPDCMAEKNKKYVHSVLGDLFRMVDCDDTPSGKRLKGTSEMDSKEFWDYIDECRALYHDWYGGEIPDPIPAGYDRDEL